MSIPIWSSLDVYTGTEASLAMLPKVPQGKRAGLVLPGYAGNGYTTFGSLTDGSSIPAALAKSGIPTISGDIGPDTLTPPGAGQTSILFANAAAMTRVTALAAYAGTRYNMVTDKVVIYGWSMGAQTAAVWAAQNTTKVAALVLAIPMLDLQWTHDNTTLATPIENAYGGNAGYLAALPTRSPVRLALAGAFSTSLPILILYGPLDTTTNGATAANAFATAVGGTNVQVQSLGTGVGHDQLPVPSSLVASFLSMYA